MKNTHWMWVAALTIGGGAVAADAPSSQYFNNTLLCQNTSNKAFCRLWLNPDGSYQLYYRFGKQPKMPEADGPFEMEGRDGTYTASSEGAMLNICLKPNPVGIPLQMETAHVFFGEQRCYEVEQHRFNDTWQQQGPDGKTYQLWMLEGR